MFRYEYLCMQLAFAYPYTFIAKAGFINIHPALPAATSSFHASLCIFSIISVTHLRVRCVCPLYTRMTREELANLRITGDVKGVEGCCLPSLPPSPYLLVIRTIFISLVVPLPSSFLLFLISSFSRCVFFIPSCANLREEDLK